MKKLLPLLLVLLLLAGCAQNDETKEITTDGTEPQTALETVADAGEQEVFLQFDDEDMTASVSPTTTKQTTAQSAQSTASTTTVGQTTASSAASTAKADKETQNTITTTTTKPATSQKNTTTAAAGGTPTTASVPTTAASGTTTSTSAATLPTADAEKGRYELPAIPLE